MTIFKNGLKICLVFLFSSCITTEKPNDSFKRILNESKILSASSLNFNGAYESNINTKNYLENPIYFFKNGLMYFQEGSTSDSSKNEIWLRKYLRDEKTWGTYEVKSDTINACLYIPYYDNANYIHYLQTNFQGIIKNKETIVQWHIMKPYPKFNKKLSNMYRFPDYESPNLYFKSIPIKPFMDSVAEKAWVNKYRKK
jgi:hypothetical protein